MSRSIRSAFVLGAAFALSSCASTHPHREAASAMPSTTSASATYIDAEALYRARVEAIAKRRGVTVRWIHPPVTRRDLAVR